MKLLDYNKNIRIIEENNSVVIINPDNKSWVKINKDFYDSNINDNSINNKLFLSLIKYKIIGEYKNNNEKKFNSIYYAITKKCNMSCDFCSMRSNPNIDTNNDLSIEEIQLNIIPKLIEFSPKRLIITGGEPLIRSDFRYIVDLLYKNLNNTKLILQTNGLLLNKEIIQSIKGKIVAIDISIENIFDNQNLYNQMINVFNNLKENNIDICFSYVINNKNKKYIIYAIDLVEKYDTNLSLKLVSPVGYALDNNSDYLDNYNLLNLYKEISEYIIEKKYKSKGLLDLIYTFLRPRKNCCAYGEMLSIYPDGKIFMCHSMPKKDFELGNIKTTPPSKLYTNLDENTSKENIKKLFIVDNMDICNDCSAKYFCSGICAADKINCNNIERLTITCTIRKIIINYILFYYNEKYSLIDNYRMFLSQVNLKLKEYKNA